MNYRITVILIVAAIIAGSWAYFFEKGQGPSGTTTATRDFPAYTGVPMENIARIKVSHLGRSQTFVKDSESQWHFNETTGPLVDTARWGGVTLLLSGPNARRLFQQAEDYAAFGLDNPQSVIDVTMDSGLSFGLLLGDKTPDGVNHYVQFRDDQKTTCSEGLCPQVYLIDGSWGDVLARLVVEPPVAPSPAQQPQSGS